MLYPCCFHSQATEGYEVGITQHALTLPREHSDLAPIDSRAARSLLVARLWRCSKCARPSFVNGRDVTLGLDMAKAGSARACERVPDAVELALALGRACSSREGIASPDFFRTNRCFTSSARPSCGHGTEPRL